jgi:hypothetical protein
MTDVFTIEEVNLMCAFDTGSRAALISGLAAAMPEFEEPEMAEVAEGALRKLSKMSGADFEAAALDFYPTYESSDETEV